MCSTLRCWLMLVAVVLAVAALASSAVADYPTTVLGDGAIGYWRLGEPIGPTAVDATGSAADLNYVLFPPDDFGQPGAILGDADTAVRFTPTPGGNAPLLEPTTHPHIVSPNTTDFGFVSGQSFSIEYWIKVAPDSESDSDVGIIDKGYDSVQETPWYLSRFLPNHGGNVDFYLRDASSISFMITSATNIDDDQWHQVVCVYDDPSAQTRIFVDGILEGLRENVNPAAYGMNLRPFTIGNHYNRGFDGLLDEVAVYDSALSAAQVAAHYQEGSGTELPPPQPELNIDFGSILDTGGGPGGLQAGFLPLEATEADSVGVGDDVTRTFPSTLGAGDTVDVTVGGYTHFRDYAAATGDFAIATDLLSEGVLANAGATIRLTLENLLDGKYEIITYHHTTQNGPNARPPATPFDVYLTDGVVTNEAIALGAEMSDNASSSLSAQTFQFEVVGGSSVAMDFVRPAVGTDHFQIPGFEVVPWVLLVWDGTGDGVWGDIDGGDSRWQNENGLPTSLYPDVPPDPGIGAHAAIAANVVTMAADRTARSLTVERDPLDVNPVGVILNDSTTLSVERAVDFGADTTLTLGAGSVLSAGGQVTLGEDSSLTLGDGATLAAGTSYRALVFGGSLTIGTGSTVTLGDGVALSASGAINAPAGVPLDFGAGGTLAAGETFVTSSSSVHSLSSTGDLTVRAGSTFEVLNYTDHDAGGRFAKQGPGTLILNNSNGTAIDLDTSDIWVDEGTLEAIGVDPLGGAEQVTLNGGTLLLARAIVDPGAGPSEGLVGHWAFDETSGTNAENSANPGVNDGTLQAMDDNPWVAGKIGGALSFDGVDDFVLVSQDSGLPIYNNGVDNAYSVAMWVKGPPQNDMRVFSEGSTDGNNPLFNLGTNTAGQLDMFIRDDEGAVQVNHRVSSDTVFDDRWQHIAWVEDDGAATLYVNGVRDSAGFSYTRSALTLNTTTIGGILRAAPSHFFTGLIDDVHVYNRALGEGEVEAMAGSGSLDTGGLDVVVADDSTLRVVANGVVAFDSLKLMAGTLTNTGAAVTFTGTTLETDATAVGFDMQSPLDPGLIDGSSEEATISKSGPEDLVLNRANVNLERAKFNVQEGRLIGVGASNPFDAADLQLTGGEVVLAGAAAGVDVAYDNALIVETGGTLTAGSGDVGATGPLTVTLGSEANGVTLGGGILSVQATDDYQLEIAGAITGPGGMRTSNATVTLQRGGDFGSLSVAGGTLDMAADVHVQMAVFSGGVINTAGHQVVVSEQMRLGGTMLEVDAGNTFAVEADGGTDLLAGQHVTLGDGRLTLTGERSLISDAVGVWTFDNVVGTTVANEGLAGGVADGMLAGGATIVPGHLGSAASLDGAVGTQIVIPDHPDFEFPAEQSFTISLWYRYNGIEADPQGLITKGYDGGGSVRAANYYLMRIETAGEANLHSRPTSAGTPAVDLDNPNVNLGDDIWHQVTLVRDSEANEIRLYADNVPVVLDMLTGDTNGDWNMGVNDHPLVIGNHGDRFTPGMFDDVLIFRRALVPDEVAALWGGGSGPGGYAVVKLPHTDYTIAAGSAHTLVMASQGEPILGSLILEDSATLGVENVGALNVDDLNLGDGSTVASNLFIRGVIRPGGSIGTGTISGFVEMDEEDAGYAVELGGAENDLLIVQNGDIEIAGRLSVQAIGKLASVKDQVLRVVQVSGEDGIYGEFSSVPRVGDFGLPSTDPNRYGDYLGYGVWFGNDKTGQGVTYVGRTYDPPEEYDPWDPASSVDIAVFQAKPGDCNGDRSISFADFNDLANNYTGALGPGVGGKEWRQGDFNGDADVDFGDFNDLANNYTGAGVEYGPGTPAGDAKAAPGEASLIVYLADVADTDGVSHAAGDVVLLVEGGESSTQVNGYEVYSAAGLLVPDEGGVPYPLIGGAYMEDSAAAIVAFGGLTSPLSVSGDQEFALGWKYNAAATAEQDLEFYYGTSGGVISGNVLYVVPEPGTLLLLACGALGFLLWRRRRAA